MSYRESARHAMQRVRKAPRHRRRIALWLLLVLVVVCAAAWFSGAVATGIVHVARRHLPYQTGRDFRVDRVTYVDALPDAEDRLYFRLSRSRFRRMLQESPVPGWLVPPGLIRDGLFIESTWSPWKRDKQTREKAPVGIEVPIGIVIGETNGDHPHVDGRLPVSLLNDYIRVEFKYDLAENTETYALGHYTVEFSPDVLRATLRTTNAVSLSAESYADALFLELDAQGRVTLWINENIGMFRFRANISELLVAMTLRPTRLEDRISLGYEAVFRRLRGNVKNLPNFLDRDISRRLKKKWHRSLNKDRRKQRLADRKVPLWFPIDLVVDVEFYPSNGAAK